MNSSFLPESQLQFAWDSTSLGLLKECPRKYQLSIVQGYAPSHESVHLTFGLIYHAALERYDHAKAQGAPHAQALREAVHCALTQSWDRNMRRPWLSDDPNKNRLTLVRTVVWYLDQFAEDPIQTVILANGKPAVELSFRMELEYNAPNGDPYLLCGHLDRVGDFNGHTYIIDRKTTKSTINQGFFDKFSPDNQFSTYAFAGKVVYKLPIKGIIVDGAQVAVTFSRFMRAPIPRTDGQLEEWHRDLGLLLEQAERYARDGYWPMNDKSCGNYGGCPFRDICSLDPKVREAFLTHKYKSRTWDPLQTRGDI